MVEETVFEMDGFPNLNGIVTLTLDWVILHTAVHHSPTFTYTPNFIKVEETF